MKVPHFEWYFCRGSDIKRGGGRAKKPSVLLTDSFKTPLPNIILVSSPMAAVTAKQLLAAAKRTSVINISCCSYSSLDNLQVAADERVAPPIRDAFRYP